MTNNEYPIKYRLVFYANPHIEEPQVVAVALIQETYRSSTKEIHKKPLALESDEAIFKDGVLLDPKVLSRLKARLFEFCLIDRNNPNIEDSTHKPFGELDKF